MIPTPSIPDDTDWYSHIRFNSINPSVREPSPEGPQLNVIEGFYAAAIFLDCIWLKNKSKSFFSENDFDYLAQFCSCFYSDPAAENDWKRCYLLAKGKLLPPRNELYSIDNDLISFSEAFQILKLMTEWYNKHFGFDFPQILSLFASMLNEPSKYASYWDLWNQAVQKAKMGQRFFSDDGSADDPKKYSLIEKTEALSLPEIFR